MVTVEGGAAAVNNPFLLVEIPGSGGMRGARFKTGMAVLLTSVVMVRRLCFSREMVVVGHTVSRTALASLVVFKDVSATAIVSTASSLKDGASIGSVGRIKLLHERRV